MVAVTEMPTVIFLSIYVSFNWGYPMYEFQRNTRYSRTSLYKNGDLDIVKGKFELTVDNIFNN